MKDFFLLASDYFSNLSSVSSHFYPLKSLDLLLYFYTLLYLLVLLYAVLSRLCFTFTLPALFLRYLHILLYFSFILLILLTLPAQITWHFFYPCVFLYSSHSFYIHPLIFILIAKSIILLN